MAIIGTKLTIMSTWRWMAAYAITYVIAHPWGLYLICTRHTRGWSIYKSDTNLMDVLQLLCFMVCEWIKGALSLYLAWRTGGLADGKPWVFMPLSWNRFTMPTRVTNLAFGISTNIPLVLLTSWLLALYARRALCIMANPTCIALQRSSAKPSWCVVYLFWDLFGGN